jgi:hypothetical protein
MALLGGMEGHDGEVGGVFGLEVGGPGRVGGAGGGRIGSGPLAQAAGEIGIGGSRNGKQV